MYLNKYKAQTLITGYRINQKIEDKFVAVPKKRLGKDCIVYYSDDKMIIRRGTKPVYKETFEDKFNRYSIDGNKRTYTLCYFKWIPDKKNEQVSVFDSINNMPEDKKANILAGMKKAIFK